MLQDVSAGAPAQPLQGLLVRSEERSHGAAEGGYGRLCPALAGEEVGSCAGGVREAYCGDKDGAWEGERRQEGWLDRVEE